MSGYMKKEVNFYRKKLQGLIVHLQKINNSKINAFINENYNEDRLLTDDNMRKIVLCQSPTLGLWEKGEYGALKYLDKMIGYFNYHLGELAYFISAITATIYQDEQISNIDFIRYLDRHNITIVLINDLKKFHSWAIDEVFKTKSIKDLEKVYSFKYLGYSTKKKIANTILERLNVSKKTKKEKLDKWHFHTIQESKKIKYLKSLESEKSTKEYLDLMLLYVKLESKNNVKLYIYNYLLETGELVKHLDLMKQAFQENITNFKNGKRYFDLIFKYAKDNQDIKTLNWMYSVYKNSTQYERYVANGKEVIREYIKSLKA